MTWLSLLFIHWPVAVEALRRLVPEPLELDTFDGHAWLGLIPFTMRDVRCTWLPTIPTMRHFHECNVRTYVTIDGEPGVYFVSLDAASRLAVHGARMFWNLNYFLSKMSLQRDGDVAHYSVQRRCDPAVTMRCAWRIGEKRLQSQPGELAHFLTERYMLYTVDRHGTAMRGRIWHAPWPLRDAELLELDDSLVAATGARLDGGTPVLYHADQLRAEAWPLQRA